MIAHICAVSGTLIYIIVTEFNYKHYIVIFNPLCASGLYNQFIMKLKYHLYVAKGLSYCLFRPTVSVN